MPSPAAPDGGVPASADAARERVLRHRGGVLVVLGGPGTGKTTLGVELVRRRVREDGVDPDRCLALTPTRQAAARLRIAIGAGLGRTHTEPLARTPASLAFSVLRLSAAAEGGPTPRLLSGAEQDVILRELLAGHEEEGTGPRWPEHVLPALPTSGFRAQLRDLLMRTVEHGLEPEGLAAMGREHDRPEWVAAAQVLAEYDQVTALSEPGAYDPAWICTAAADRLEDDPDLLRAVRERIGLVVVDDAQELTASATRLLSVLHRPGQDLVLLGDPDSSVLGFRGARPGGFLALADLLAAEERRPVSEPSPVLPGLEELAVPTRLGAGGEGRRSGTTRSVGGETPTVVLPARRAGGPRLTEVVDRVAERIGAVGGTAHRRALPAVVQPVAAVGTTDPQDAVESGVARSAAHEASYVAHWLRSGHLRDGVPWSAMAVVARSGTQQELVRRALTAGEVPVRTERSSVPLGYDPAVAPLLLALDVVTQGAAGSEDEAEGPRGGPVDGLPSAGGGGSLPGWCLGPDQAVDLLTSPLGGVDPVQLRRLRRRLRVEEVAAGGDRSADELLAATVADDALRVSPVDLVDADLLPLVEVGRILDAGRRAALDPATAGDAEAILWALWDASGLASRWGSLALSGGPAGVRADRDLDAVLVLFGAASSFVERLPGAGPRRFLDHVRSAEVAADTLVSGAHLTEAVELLTPAAAAGRHFDRVAVVGVQEGLWPDLRLRDTLLGAEALVAALAGAPIGGPEAVRAAQAQVRSDELRQFLVAVSRAREQLLVTAVASTDEQPSVLLDLVGRPGAEASRRVLEAPRSATLRGLVGQLRRTAVLAHREGDLARRDQALDALLRLADESVAGADPEDWLDGRALSTDRPLAPTGAVRVSPSRLQTYLDCPLRWFLTGRGADTGGAAKAEIGTLVHSIVAEHPDAELPELTRELDRRWGEVVQPPGWIADRHLDEARAMLSKYVGYRTEAAAAGRTLVGTELALRVTLTPSPEEEGRAVVVTGSVDRLERDAEGRLVVADLKTGKTGVQKQELPRHAQLGAYQVAVEAGAFEREGAGRTSGGAVLVPLGLPTRTLSQSQVPLASDDDPEWARRQLLGAAEGMGDRSFVAREGTQCWGCKASFCCPVQPEGAQR